MNILIEILPLCLVRIIAKSCKLQRFGNRVVQVPAPGVMIEAEEKPPEIPESQYALGIGA